MRDIFNRNGRGAHRDSGRQLTSPSNRNTWAERNTSCIEISRGVPGRMHAWPTTTRPAPSSCAILGRCGHFSTGKCGGNEHSSVYSVEHCAKAGGVTLKKLHHVAVSGNFNVPRTREGQGSSVRAAGQRCSVGDLGRQDELLSLQQGSRQRVLDPLGRRGPGGGGGVGADSQDMTRI